MEEKEIEKIILKEYMQEKNIICGCEEISFEDYKKFRLSELGIKIK